MWYVLVYSRSLFCYETTCFVGLVVLYTRVEDYSTANICSSRQLGEFAHTRLEESGKCDDHVDRTALYI
jgi:hypothetical protein